jgi:hydrogenase nickel incorporation protein HypA/HybF
MHELSLCQALVDQVQEVAAQHGAHSVGQVRVKVGPLAGVEPALLENAYPMASAGTVAEGSTMTIETGQLKVRCLYCGAVTEAQPNRLVCGACGDYRTKVESGDELMLLSVELFAA